MNNREERKGDQHKEIQKENTVFLEGQAEKEAMTKEDQNKDKETKARTEEAKHTMAQERD